MSRAIPRVHWRRRISTAPTGHVDARRQISGIKTGLFVRVLLHGRAHRVGVSLLMPLSGSAIGWRNCFTPGAIGILMAIAMLAGNAAQAMPKHAQKATEARLFCYCQNPLPRPQVLTCANANYGRRGCHAFYPRRSHIRSTLACAGAGFDRATAQMTGWIGVAGAFSATCLVESAVTGGSTIARAASHVLSCPAVSGADRLFASSIQTPGSSGLRSSRLFSAGQFLWADFFNRTGADATSDSLDGCCVLPVGAQLIGLALGITFSGIMIDYLWRKRLGTVYKDAACLHGVISDSDSAVLLWPNVFLRIATDSIRRWQRQFRLNAN